MTLADIHPGTHIDTIGRVRFGPIAGKIFDALCDHPYGLTTRELIEHCYGDRADGGPDSADNCISVRVCYMNKRWKEMGSCLRIRGHGGPGSRYQVWIVR